jgi:hypothetical protein
MMRWYAFLFLVVLLPAGCASRGVSGNAQGGVVSSALGSEAQLGVADAHCRRFDKKARLGDALETGSVTFDCIR